MKSIINLTQHTFTPEQAMDLRERGIEIVDGDSDRIKRYLTFNSLPDEDDLNYSAWHLAKLANEAGVDVAMIGGAPYFMPYLEEALKERGIKPIYAFTMREAEERLQIDGSVEKVSVFKHKGWVGL